MPGHWLILLALGFCVYAAIAAPASTRRVGGRAEIVRPELLQSARRAIVAAAAALTLSSAALWYALFTRDFSIAYVAQNVSQHTPPWYTFSAFWAGMDGSMLLWCWVLALLAAAFVGKRRPELDPFVVWAIPVLAVTIGFFVAMTAGPTNPFGTLDVAPADGRGLNPLLQSPGMLIHPPVLYVGFVGLSIPFAICVSALITGRTGPEWLRVARRWTLIPWLALGAGKVLGGAWAYTELGWGGYWGWDPVENAALLPWLAATAFLHSAMIQERRGMLKVWNVFLVLLAANLAVFGTFLTRSGLLSSVHTFTESDLGRWFFFFLTAQTLGGLALLAWRLPMLRSESSFGSPLSKEAGFLVNNLLFVGTGVVILWGTMLPLITEAIRGQQMAVGPPFFNRVVGPLGALLLLLAAVGPLLRWRRGSLRNLGERLARPAAAATVASVPVILVTRHPLFTGLIWVAAVVAAVSVSEILTAARARARLTGQRPSAALTGLVTRNPRRYGGYVVHLGIAIMAVGFAGSLFNVERDVRVEPGQQIEVAGYTIVYQEMVRGRLADRDVRIAELDVHRGERHLATIHPQQNVHRNYEGQPRSRIAIRTTPREDLYVILAGTWEDSDEIVLRVHVNPLVFWVWLGGAVAVLGGLIALVSARAPATQPAVRRPTAQEVQATSTS